MRATKYLYTIMCALLAVAFTACDKDAHENEYPLGSGEGAFIAGLQSEKTVENLAVYLFGSEGAAVRRYDYTDPHTPASECLPVKAGAYTVLVVANVPATDLPQQTTVADLAEWLDENSGSYPGLLTASAQESVTAGEVKRLLLTLKDGTGGISLSTLRLLLTLPGKAMPDYVAVRSASANDNAPSLRLTAEVYKQGTDTRVHRRALLCEPQTDGRYLAELSLLEGSYDLRLWADWTFDGTTDDKYYKADDLSAVTVLTDNYVANGETDKKDACYATATAISLAEGTQDESITLTRPFARYRLVATDVEGYRNLMNKENYPPIEDLRVSVTYEGFFPTGFNVASGKPNDALTAITYTAYPVTADGYTPDEARQVGADFVLTNGEESSVTVTIKMIDRNSGREVSTLQGVKIPYRRGYLTTVTGTFLTAGKATGGLQIDTGWEGDDYIIEF